MARPRKDAEGEPVRDRLRAAFLELVAERDIAAIPIGELTRRARCNRGTFYYHYADIFALLDDVVERSIPDALPKAILGVAIGGAPKAVALGAIEESREAIDRACLLLNSSAADRLRSRVLERARGYWEDWAGVPSERLDPDAFTEERALLEFAVNGVLGVLAYRGRIGLEHDLAAFLRALLPEIPLALGKCLRRHRKATNGLRP